MARQRRPRREQPRDVRPVERAYRQRAVVYQCLECGARADTLYGVGDQSWCPHCGQGGTVIGEEGKFPLPHLYEQWQREQRRRSQKSDQQADITLPYLVASKKTATMHIVKRQSGIFYCSTCWIEGLLIEQESLKCGRCGGLLKRGRLEDASPRADSGPA